MAEVEDIKVLDRDQANADLLMAGLFRRDGDVLRINATIKDNKAGTIISAGKVLISAREIYAKDLLPAGASFSSESASFHPLRPELDIPPPLTGGGQGERVRFLCPITLQSNKS